MRTKVEIPTCPFCGVFILDTDSIRAGICTDCRDVIRDEQDVAWESHRERVCKNPTCFETLGIGQNKYCTRCAKDARRSKELH